jgi:hypothetical protein
VSTIAYETSDVWESGCEAVRNGLPVVRTTSVTTVRKLMLDIPTVNYETFFW